MKLEKKTKNYHHGNMLYLLVILYSIIELDEPIPNIENAHTRIVYFIDVFNSFTLINKGR